MKSYLWAAGLIVVLLSGCNREHKRVIAVIPKDNADLFWQSVHAGAVKAGRESGVDVLWNGPASEADYTQQLQIVDAMINRHVDAIALAPTDRQALVSVVERAAARNVPVVIFDSGIDTQRFVSQVATDNYKAGQLAGERMGKILDGKGKVVIVAVKPGAASTEAREKGFEEIETTRTPYPRTTRASVGEDSGDGGRRREMNREYHRPPRVSSGMIEAT
jgi:ribose transport system substrate-binding protein